VNPWAGLAGEVLHQANWPVNQKRCKRMCFCKCLSRLGIGNDRLRTVSHTGSPNGGRGANPTPKGFGSYGRRKARHSPNHFDRKERGSGKPRPHWGRFSIKQPPVAKWSGTSSLYQKGTCGLPRARLGDTFGRADLGNCFGLRRWGGRNGWIFPKPLGRKGLMGCIARARTHTAARIVHLRYPNHRRPGKGSVLATLFQPSRDRLSGPL
jgi:hypothetical protein